MQDLIEVYEVEKGEQRPTDVLFHIERPTELPAVGDLLVIDAAKTTGRGTGYIGGGGSHIAYEVVQRAQMLAQAEKGQEFLSHWVYVRVLTKSEYWDRFK